MPDEDAERALCDEHAYGRPYHPMNGDIPDEWVVVGNCTHQQDTARATTISTAGLLPSNIPPNNLGMSERREEEVGRREEGGGGTVRA